ncbi:MAG TPA: dihydrodipicolinate synthase family protein [Hyphomicrobiales bacterium]|nr:dihydrodipicolinate synthase family protein [Hyphomicrobiales bacterium]
MTVVLPPKGVFAAAVTPVSPQGEPDVGLFVPFARHLLESGCNGLAPLGTTGEANSIGVGDRLAFIEDIADHLPMDRIVVGTGAQALADAMVLSRVATQAGAALLLLPPFYYKNPSEEGLYAFYSRLVDGLGGLEPRILLYHFPQMSAVPITLELTRRLREAYPGVFIGLKDSSGDFDNTRAMIEAFDDFAVYSGSEEFLARNLEAGGAGCISASVNVTAPLVGAVYAARGTDAFEATQAKATAARVALQRQPMIPVLKAIVAARLGEPDFARVLPPFTALSESGARALFATLASHTGLHDLDGLAPVGLDD